ncbi:MAG: glycosyltransferase family 39 protein [Prevotellaceae bacterium]|jgi:uncharacterized membrane protein YqaE (UPF0057 family)|nr:glycosyltransferase family 39 protein [Prevotellaceae bacterium]
MSIINYFKAYYAQKPLACILTVALLLRLVAAIFARGYGMYDDHFYVIEEAGSLVDSVDAFGWLPGSPNNAGPAGLNLVYMGLHYLLFTLLNAVGLTAPDAKMYVVRALHAVYSLSIVYFGYKIAGRYAGKKPAAQVGWLLAAFWFMPWLSVRNLVEVHCIPFLLWGLWMYIKRDSPGVKTVLLSGLVAGLAFSIRYQAIFMLAGFGLALLCLRQFRSALVWGGGALFSMVAVQGCVDLYFWGKPCVEFIEYLHYNLVVVQPGDYPGGGPFKYVALIAGILIPPVSVFIFAGFFARWRKYLLLFLPSFIFLLFHSFFVNKQERFILTIVPFIIILGAMGWSELLAAYGKVAWLQKLARGSWKFFVVANALLLCVISVHYSKKARVEAMLYLSRYPQVEQLARMSNIPVLPLFYLGEWPAEQPIDRHDAAAGALRLLESGMEPRFVLLAADGNVAEQVDALKQHLPELVFEAEIKPSLIDNLMFFLNPRHNVNETIYIYRNQKYFPEKR